MLCNRCYQNEAYIFLDCYCIFCLDCYDNKIEFLIQQRKKTIDNNNKKLCQFCNKKTNFKLCDKRKKQDRETIRQLTIHPDKANLRAVETTKFHFLQKKKEIDFLKNKNEFLDKLVIHLMQENGKQIDKIPSQLKQQDNYQYLENLRDKIEAFHIDEIQSNQNFNFYQQSTKHQTRNNKLEQNYEQQKQDTNQNSYYNQNVKRFSSGKNFLNFQLKSIKEQQPQIQEKSEAIKKYKLQNMLMKNSNFVTPFIRKR